jgi:hypothetical protein
MMPGMALFKVFVEGYTGRHDKTDLGTNHELDMLRRVLRGKFSTRELGLRFRDSWLLRQTFCYFLGYTLMRP